VAAAPKTKTKACIFCPNPRTRKRGEHLWDDWLNREGGKDIRDQSTTYYFGPDGALIRSHPSSRIDVTLPVVCDRCNQTWMSDLSTRTKYILEPSIRRDEPRDYDTFDIVTLASFFFLKAAVLDWSVESIRRPCISRSACLDFRDSLVLSHDGDIAVPLNLQIWIARYRRTHRMEAQAFTEELTGQGPFKGYRILLITYVVGSFIFQLTYPRWARRTRNRPTAPFFQIVGDNQSVPIWPRVVTAYWPPPTYVDSRTLEIFRQRLRRILIPRIG
jgi:hypothetical protein